MGPLPQLRAVQGRCGKVAAAAGGALRRRTVAALHRFGALLEPGEAIKPLKQLLRVCRVVLAERGPSRSVGLQRNLLSYHARTAALRSGGRQKLLPRVTLLRKLQLRHLQRLAASAFGSGSRCAELLPLVDLQLRLSTHRYAKVRRAAQDGANVSLRLHPWLGRQHLPRLIGVLSDPRAAAHECKGAAFLLHASSVMRKVAGDWTLLCQLLTALCHAQDHALPKLQQRMRALFSALIESHHAPALTWAPTPLSVGGGGDGGSGGNGGEGEGGGAGGGGGGGGGGTGGFQSPTAPQVQVLHEAR